jgi:hypothetical protein
VTSTTWQPVEIAPATKYDSETFAKALRKFNGEAAHLTDDEIAMLALVDPNLGERATVARAGIVEARDEDDREFAEHHVSFKFLIGHHKNHIAPLLAAHRVMLRELQESVTWLESQFRQPDGVGIIGQFDAVEAKIERNGGLSVAQRVNYTKDLDDLRARLDALERRPELKWFGVWDSDTAYHEGNLVTWSGSVWYATKTTRGRKPGEAATPDWRLIVQRGRDGKSWKDIERDRAPQ